MEIQMETDKKKIQSHRKSATPGEVRGPLRGGQGDETHGAVAQERWGHPEEREYVPNKKKSNEPAPNFPDQTNLPPFSPEKNGTTENRLSSLRYMGEGRRNLGFFVNTDRITL